MLFSRILLLLAVVFALQMIACGELFAQAAPPDAPKAPVADANERPAGMKPAAEVLAPEQPRGPKGGRQGAKRQGAK